LILRTGFRPGPGRYLVTGWFLNLRTGLDLLHRLIAGPVLELGLHSRLDLQLVAGVCNVLVLLQLNLLSGAITGAVLVRPRAVPAPGRHRRRCGPEHEGC
jgi:hypothetical protein